MPGFRITTTRIFAALMLASAIAMLLPPRWARHLDGLKGLLQPLAPFQDLTERGGRAADAALDRWATPSVSLDRLRRVERQRDALRNELVALRHRLDELSRVSREIAELRRRESLRRYRLIPARVIARSPAVGRDTLRAKPDRRERLRDGQPVVTALTLAAGRQDGLVVEQAVVHQAYLIGTVCEVLPLLSGVRLFSDPAVKLLPVHVVRAADGEVIRRLDAPKDRPAPAVFGLNGLGDGHMQIAKVNRDYRIRRGDLVVSAGTQRPLPAMMVVGTVLAVENDPDLRLVQTLTVAAPVDPMQLDWVYALGEP